MAEDNAGVTRRTLLRSAAGATVAGGAAAGTATAQEERPDFGGWLEEIDGGYENMRGEETVTVSVGAEGNGGAYAFSPAGLWIDPGTTVQFEWTGEGAAHNVVADSGPADLSSGDPVEATGVEYEYEFTEEDGGITQYLCEPHAGLGMQGAIAVGEDVSTQEVGGGGGGGGRSVPQVPESAKALGVAASFVMVSTLGMAYFFTKYGGDYEMPGEE
jgi:halocyanin-like protein